MLTQLVLVYVVLNAVESVAHWTILVSSPMFADTESIALSSHRGSIHIPARLVSSICLALNRLGTLSSTSYTPIIGLSLGFFDTCLQFALASIL